ncbi:MAG: hypothetical protein DME33_05565 [Verrucomicrobia bacterium]|nr:MAG: hypothetical protein DME33_05565 [Verrucomicrobiota bacterium]
MTRESSARQEISISFFSLVKPTRFVSTRKTLLRFSKNKIIIAAGRRYGGKVVGDEIWLNKKPPRGEA